MSFWKEGPRNTLTLERPGTEERALEQCGSLHYLLNPLLSGRCCGVGVLSLEAWQRPSLASVSLAHLVGRPFPSRRPSSPLQVKSGIRTSLVPKPPESSLPHPDTACLSQILGTEGGDRNENLAVLLFLLTQSWAQKCQSELRALHPKISHGARRGGWVSF